MMSVQVPDTRILLSASRTYGLQQEMLMAADVTCLQGRSVQPPPSPDTQHYELCCLAYTVSPALATGGTKPHPGHAPSSSPLPFPAQVSSEDQHTGFSLIPCLGCSHFPQRCSLPGKSPTLACTSENTFPSRRPGSKERSPQSLTEATLGNKNLLNKTCCVLITQNQYSQHHQHEDGKIKR